MKLSSDNIIAICAAFVAVLSLYISIRQMKVSIRQMMEQSLYNQNALRPLPWFYIHNGEDDFYVKLYNDGPGPMIVVSTLFELEGKQHPYLHCVLPRYAGQKYAVLSPGKIIGAGREVRIWYQPFFGSPNDDDRTAAEPDDQSEYTSKQLDELKAQVNDMKRHLSRVIATVVYKDVYNNQFTHHREFDFLTKMDCKGR